MEQLKYKKKGLREASVMICVLERTDDKVAPSPLRKIRGKETGPTTHDVQVRLKGRTYRVTFLKYSWISS